MDTKRTDLKIPYGISDFKRLRQEKYYYVDKSEYIRKLELAGNFLFFVRPRRFGKSLFANMLHQIVFQFRVTELVRVEHVAQDDIPAIA